MWSVTISGPNFPTHERRLAPGATLILGRTPENDVVLPAGSVSRRHAQLTATDRGVRLSDLGSLNGTQLNGQDVGQVSRPIGEGDVATIGDFVLRVSEWLDAGAVPRRAAPEGFVTVRASEPSHNPFLTRCGPRRPAAQAAVDPEYAPLLYALAELLAGGPPLTSFLQEVLDCALGVTGFEGAVLLRSPGGGFQVLLGELGSAAHPLPWSSSLVAKTVERRATLLVNQLQGDARFNAHASVVRGGHLRVVCAPLLHGTEVLGALYLATRSAAAPAQEVVDFVSALAQLAATAVDRDRRERSPATEQGLPFQQTGPFQQTDPLQPLAEALAGERMRALQDALAELDQCLNAPPGTTPLPDVLAQAQRALADVRRALAPVSPEEQEAVRH